MADTKVIVEGVGAYLPGEKVPTADIEDYVGHIPGLDVAKSYRVIEKFAGIRFRHYSLEKHTGRLIEDSVSLATKAARIAIERAGIKATDLDLIVTTTSTPPYLRAGLANQVRLRLGNAGCTTYDLWGACTGIQQAITLAASGIRAGLFRHALLIGVELPSTSGRAENYACHKVTRFDLLLRAALGDGAGALVLSASDRPGDEDAVLYTRNGTEQIDDSAFHREAGGSTVPLNVRTFTEGLHHWHHDFEKLVKKGRPYFVDIVKRTLKTVPVPLEQVDYIVPAAANFGYFRADEYIAGADPEDRVFWRNMVSRVFTNFPEVGNIPSAAVYVALNELYERGKLKKDTKVLLASIEGATWGWGASLLRWCH